MTTTPRLHWWLSLALLALCGGVAGVFLGPQKALAVIPRPPEDRNVLRVAYTQFLLPDPDRRTLPITTQNQFSLSLWEPLVECDPATGEPRPAAAESWTWSPDRLELTVRLRPDARWSNGAPVTAHDFVRGWHHLLRQRIEWAQSLFALKNAEAFHHGKIKDPAAVGMHAVDDLTLRLELNQVRSTLLAELADPLLVPLPAGSEQVLAEHAYFSHPEKLVTNGPFQLQSASYNGYRLVACPYYHGHNQVRLAGVHFIRATDSASATLMLAAGLVDVVSPTPWEERPMPTNRPVRRETELVLGVTLITFNVTRGPLQDVRVRQALALALDRMGPIERFNPGRMIPAWSWVPDMPGRPGLVLLNEDVKEARRLLAAAGYAGGNGFPVLDVSLPLWMKSDPYPEIWTERWFQALGVKTHLIYEPVPIRAKRMTSGGEYDVLYGTYFATVPDAGDLMSGFLWSTEYSESKWSDPQVTQLLTEANAKVGAEHLVSLEKAERLIVASVPSVPVMFEQRQSMLAGEVQGWYAEPLARQSFKRLWLSPSPESSSTPELGL